MTQNSGPEDGHNMVTGVQKERSYGHDMVTGVQKELRYGFDMATGATEQIRNDHDMVTGATNRHDMVTRATDRHDMVTGATEQIGNRHDMVQEFTRKSHTVPRERVQESRKRTSLPLNRNSAVRIPLRRSKQTKLFWPFGSWQITTILRTFIITTTEFPNCQSHSPQ